MKYATLAYTTEQEWQLNELNEFGLDYNGWIKSKPLIQLWSVKKELKNPNPSMTHLVNGYPTHPS